VRSGNVCAVLYRAAVGQCASRTCRYLSFKFARQARVLLIGVGLRMHRYVSYPECNCVSGAPPYSRQPASNLNEQLKFTNNGRTPGGDDGADPDDGGSSDGGRSGDDDGSSDGSMDDSEADSDFVADVGHGWSKGWSLQPEAGFRKRTAGSNRADTLKRKRERKRLEEEQQRKRQLEELEQKRAKRKRLQQERGSRPVSSSLASPALPPAAAHRSQLEVSENELERIRAARVKRFATQAKCPTGNPPTVVSLVTEGCTARMSPKSRDVPRLATEGNRVRFLRFVSIGCQLLLTACVAPR
jgi:hypothetical protein